MSNSYQATVSTGIPGLDAVLHGGIPQHGTYLLQGEPGVGKTTFGLQFLLEGARTGAPAMYVSFAEGRAELAAVARTHGWDLEQITIYEAFTGSDAAALATDQTMYHPSEVELEEIMRPLLDEFERVRPQRLVIDSVSQIRLMARDPVRYRRHLLTLKAYFAERGCSALIIDDMVPIGCYDVVKTVVHGIFSLEKRTPIYGTTRRRLTVDKLRGVQYTATTTTRSVRAASRSSLG
jgi:circadian clock protein KaiC